MTATQDDPSTVDTHNSSRAARARARVRVRIGTLSLWLIAAALGATVILMSRRQPRGVTFVDAPNPLDTPVANVHLHGVPLQRAVAVLQETAGANIVVDWSDATRERIPPESKVDVDLHAVTLRAALNALISQATALYVLDVHDGVIHVRRPNVPGTFVMRSYDVRDLIAPSVAPPAGSGPADPALPQADGFTPEERLAECLQYVLGMGNGGGGQFGSTSTPVSPGPTVYLGVTAWGGRIVVYDDLDGQRNVEQVLAELRRAKAEARLLPSH